MVHQEFGDRVQRCQGRGGVVEIERPHQVEEIILCRRRQCRAQRVFKARPDVGQIADLS